jgi:hypothetical protein
MKSVYLMFGPCSRVRQRFVLAMQRQGVVPWAALQCRVAPSNMHQLSERQECQAQLGPDDLHRKSGKPCAGTVP